LFEDPFFVLKYSALYYQSGNGGWNFCSRAFYDELLKYDDTTPFIE